ncbi:MAG: hypothetical protein E7582_05485 [Ruminococcaceae bacterium]|nr:hypothetical protein [Oscillospiraceae bacterium]
MEFYIILALFVIVPLISSIFYGTTNRGHRLKKFINEYNYQVLVVENKLIDKLLCALFSPTKKKGSRYIYYAQRFYIVLAILQIPICLIFFFNTKFPVWYFFSLAIVCLIPKIIFWVMVGLLERKLHKYNKKMGIKEVTIWNFLKFDKKLKTFEKYYKYENQIRDAINPYITTSNPKKRKSTISICDVDKVISLVEKVFPKAYTEQVNDEKGNSILNIYIKSEDYTKLIVTAFIVKLKK